MDGLIITAAVILAVVAIIEIVTVFFSLPVDSAPPYVTVLPVFADDKLFERRLEYLMQKGCGRRSAILVNYTADLHQTELCRRFVHDNPDAVFISKEELERFFTGIFSPVDLPQDEQL